MDLALNDLQRLICHKIQPTIIKEWFFYINHFSLIIFYHSVWLGFELFRLRAQVYSQSVQFTLANKGYDNHHCHNKPPDRKWGWCVDDVMTGRDGPENLRILKKSHLRSGDWTMEAENWVSVFQARVKFLPLKDVVWFFGSLLTEIYTSQDVLCIGMGLA